MEWTPRFVSALAVLCCCWALAAAAPYQELPPRAGHVPVYIREGETPLAEIHPKLAEAFHEDESGSLMPQNAAQDEDAVAVDQEPSHEVEPEEPKMSEEQDESKEPEESVDSKAVEATTTKAEEPTKESDIASFEVVKAEEKEEQPTAEEGI